MIDEPHLKVGHIVVTDQSETVRLPAVCVDVDADNNGPRVWVYSKKNEVEVFIHPNEGDASDRITINRKTGKIRREVFE